MAKKILIRSPNHLGDCIMALPMVNETREAYPGSEVTVLVPENLTDVYRGNPSIDTLLTIPTRYVHGLVAVMKIKDIIASGDYDVGYILPPSFGAASAFKLAGVDQRIGYIADGRRLLLNKPLPLPVPLSSAHRSETYFNLLRRGAGVGLTFTPPKLFLNDHDIERANDLLVRFGVAEDEPYAVFAHRAVAESRRWGTDNYTELAKRTVAERQIKVVLIGGPDDESEGEKIAEAGGASVVNLAGKTTLREVASVLSRALFFVGNDSGPAHLAAAVGAPVVVLSGADNPKETSPVTPRKELVYLADLECISCVKNTCPLKGEEFMQCMRLVTVNRVEAAISRLLADGH
jgi:lipopolysaccharide heptosyltransferase II